MTTIRLKPRALVWAALVALGLAVLELGAPSPGAGAAEPAGRHVDVIRAQGVINPVMAGYITRSIDQAEADGAEALVVELDTPGGLDTSMREIIQAMLASDVPVVVYVWPPGGRAASAGLFITAAAHVAAMAPNTNIGSAHPVNLGGGSSGGQQPAEDPTMTAKVTNDAVALIQGLAQQRGRNAQWVEQAVRESVNVTADEALRLRVVDVVAPDVPTLLDRIDGREVLLGSTTRALHTAGASVDYADMGFLERLLLFASDPNVAYILMTVGVYGLIYELASPGAVFPGVAGVLALVLAFYSLGMLPINYAGLGLIVFGFALLVAEVLIAPGVGALGGGGVVSLLLGSVMLFSGAPAYFALSPWVIGTVVATTAAFFLVVLRGVTRTYRRPPVTGVPALLQETGEARTDLNPNGMVLVGGELWRARLVSGTAERGARVRVVSVDGLTLVVRVA